MVPDPFLDQAEPRLDSSRNPVPSPENYCSVKLWIPKPFPILGTAFWCSHHGAAILKFSHFINDTKSRLVGENSPGLIFQIMNSIHYIVIRYEENYRDGDSMIKG